MGIDAFQQWLNGGMNGVAGKLPFVPPGPYRYVTDWLAGQKQPALTLYSKFSDQPAGAEPGTALYADDASEPDDSAAPTQDTQPIAFADPGLLQAQQWQSKNQDSTPPANSGALSAQAFRAYDTNDMKNMSAAPVVAETPQPKPPKPINIEDYQKQLDDLDAKIDTINGAIEFGSGAALGSSADPTDYLHTLNTSLQTLKGMRQSVQDSIDAYNKASMAQSESDDYIRDNLQRWISLATRMNGLNKDERREAQDAIRVLEKRAGKHASKINPNNPDVADGCGMMLGDYVTLMDHLRNVANGGASAYFGYAASSIPEGETIQNWATNLKNKIVANTIVTNPQLKAAILDPSYDQMQAAKKANPVEYGLGNLAAFAMALWYGEQLNGAEWYNLEKGTGEGYNGNGTNYYNPKDIKPPGWNQNWEWRYPETNKPNAKPRWFDPDGGEWRWHAPDNFHSTGHWDYNPWDKWNSEWQNYI